MIFALFENIVDKMAAWEKIVALSVSIITSGFFLLKLLKKIWINVQEANSSISELFSVIPDLKIMIKEFGPNSPNSLPKLVDRLENHLFHADQKLKILALSTGTAVFETDKNGLYTLVNKRWTILAGIQYDEAMGNGWLNFINEDQREEVYKEWVSCVKQSREFYFNVNLVNSSSETVDIIARPIKNLDGTVEKFFGVIS